MPSLWWFLKFQRDQRFFTPPKPKESFAGKTIIITGSNIGLGFEAAKHAARLGASKLILAVRSQEKGEAAKAAIINETKCDPSVVEVWALDLSSYDSVKAFAAKAQSLSRLDGVLENAAIATRNFDLAEGNEASITVNVISTFLLAALLLPKLRESASRFNTTPTLTIVSSEVHFLTTIATERKAAVSNSKFKGSQTPLFDALSDRDTANMSDRYNVSKLLEVLAMRELVATRMPKPEPVVINIMNPGFCHSGLMRELGVLQYVIKFLLGARTTEVGSRTLIHAVNEAGPESHGRYLSNSRVEDEAEWIRSEEGQKVQKQVWEELVKKLEAIQEGVTKNFG